MKIKAIVQRMLRMCPAAWELQLRSLQLCCALLAGAVLLLVVCDGDLLRHYDLYIQAVSFNELSQAILLLSALGPALVEDYVGTGR